MYGVENSSMFLECSPKSQRALIYWQLQKTEDERRLEVGAAAQRTSASASNRLTETGFILLF